MKTNIDKVKNKGVCKSYYEQLRIEENSCRFKLTERVFPSHRYGRFNLSYQVDISSQNILRSSC
jgi:hypothetical protein